MTIQRRLYLALILWPAFWMPLFGIYIAAPISSLGYHLSALTVTAIAAYTCAYSVVLFCHVWRNESK